MIYNIYLKFTIIFLIIIIFYLLSYKSIEHFNNKVISYNDNIDYNNISDKLPWKHHELHSSLPTDINLKYENAYYYEYSNIEYENKIKKLFDVNTDNLISIIEGNKWSNWIYPNKENLHEIEINKLLNIYKKIYNYIDDNIKNSDLLKLKNDYEDVKIQIVHDIFKRYKKDLSNKDNFLFDLEFLFYRISKIQGKHFKFIINYNKGDIKVIGAILLGVVNEDHIIMHPVIGNDKLNKNFSEFKYKKKETFNELEQDDKQLSDDEYLDLTVQQNMYRNLLQEL